MSKYNLPKIYVVDDKDGNPKGYGPGITDVPEEAVKSIQHVYRTELDGFRITEQEAKKEAKAAAAS